MICDFICDVALQNLVPQVIQLTRVVEPFALQQQQDTACNVPVVVVVSPYVLKNITTFHNFPKRTVIRRAMLHNICNNRLYLLHAVGFPILGVG